MLKTIGAITIAALICKSAFESAIITKASNSELSPEAQEALDSYWQAVSDAKKEKAWAQMHLADLTLEMVKHNG